MEFQLISATPKGLPSTVRFQVKDKDGILRPVDKYGIYVLIRTGIKGQPHGGFQNVDREFLEIKKTDTLNDIETAIDTFAKSFIKTKYPNK